MLFFKNTFMYNFRIQPKSKLQAVKIAKNSNLFHLEGMSKNECVRYLLINDMKKGVKRKNIKILLMRNLAFHIFFFK